MSNIITLQEAEASATYYSESKCLWRAGLALGEHVELCWVRFDANAVYEMHSHSYEQISVVVQGRLLLTIGKETREVGPGDMWFVPAGVIHGGQVLGDEPLVFIDAYAPPSRGDGTDVTYHA